MIVRIDIPGSWFAGGAAGGLTTTERREKYVSVAVQFDEKHVFEAASGRRPAKMGQAIRFVSAVTHSEHSYSTYISQLRLVDVIVLYVWVIGIGIEQFYTFFSSALDVTGLGVLSVVRTLGTGVPCDI